MLIRERQQILICVAAGVLVGGFFLLRYVPLRKEVIRVEQARAAQAAVVSTAMHRSRQLPALKMQLQEFKASVGDYEARVPDHGELGLFLHQLTNLMNKHNLTEQLIEPGGAVEGEGLNQKPVSIRCKGRLNQIFEFFVSLQTLDRLVRIEKIILKNDSDFGGEVSMETEVAIYYRPPAGQG